MEPDWFPSDTKLGESGSFFKYIVFVHYILAQVGEKSPI